MEPRMLDKGSFRVVGAAAYGKLEEFNYGEIWEKQYMPFDEQVKPCSIDGGYYGVTLGERGQLLYLAGMAVEGLTQIPPGFEERLVPAAHYAVFDCGLSSIGATWQAAYGQWLPTSDYVLDTGAFDFEYYPPHSGEGEMRVEIYIPVKPKNPPE